MRLFPWLLISHGWVTWRMWLSPRSRHDLLIETTWARVDKLRPYAEKMRPDATERRCHGPPGVSADVPVMHSLALRTLPWITFPWVPIWVLPKLRTMTRLLEIQPGSSFSSPGVPSEVHL
uniref:Secreted protein n=1 Tax=Leptobrachium leishanense TaxID=445787 RepID=A0A8C5N1E5_9ANUR